MTTIDSSYAQHIAHLQERYSDAIGRCGFDALVIHSGSALKQRSVDDQYWPLKIDPSFAHWLPLREASVALVLVPGKKPRLLRPIEDNFWEGPPAAESDHFWRSFELQEGSAKSLASELPTGRVAFIGDDTAWASSRGLAETNHNPPALRNELDAVRAIKSEYEIECIASANQRAAAGHALLQSLFADGELSELDLHLRYLAATTQDDSDTPYKNIVAFGNNAAILHHVHYGRSRDASADQSLLVDAGAQCMGYASDITRTVVRGTSQAARDFGALIGRMEALQLDVIGMVRPGRPYEDLHDRSHELLAQILIDSGLCNGSPEALVDGGVTRAFFPHGLGHSLGLQVHDVGCKTTPPAEQNPFLRNTSTIAEGQVFTVEPGCYFIDGLLTPLRQDKAGALVSWATVDALRPFGGIRIEDNLAVTATASRNLTRDNWPNEP